MTLTRITSGGVDDNISFDSDTLKIDGTNNRIGIGTATPETVLDVEASGAVARIKAPDQSNARVRIEAGNSSSSFLEFGDSDDSDAGEIVYDHSNNSMRFNTSASERLRIDSSGNIGIGTASPRRHLHLHNSASATVGMMLTNADTGETNDSQGFQLKVGSDSHAEISQMEDSHIGIFTNASERLRIDSSGRLLINSTSATQSHPLQVTASSSSAEAILINARSSDEIGELSFFESDKSTRQGEIQYREDHANIRHRSGDIRFATGGVTERMRIDSNGRVGIGTSTIDTACQAVIKGSSDGVLHLDTSDGRGAFIRFQENGTSKVYVGCAEGLISGTDQDDLGLRATDNIVFRAGSSESMRIDSSGRLGVGTSSPGCQSGGIHAVHANNEGNPTFTGGEVAIFQRNFNSGQGCHIGIIGGSSGTSSINFGDKDDADRGIIQYAHGDDSMRFYTNAGEQMRLTSAGELRVGNTTNSQKAGRFQVVETRGGDQANDCNAYFETNAQDWNIQTYYNRSGTHYHIQFVEQGSQRGSVSGNDGSNVTFNQGSDYRWKENIVEMTGTEGIEICKRLKPSKYNWIENREQTGEINTVDGFIAHEVEEAGVLGAVVGEKDAVNEDGSIKGQLLDYGQMTPVLAAGIKGLIAKIETLETKVAALEAAE